MNKPETPMTVIDLTKGWDEVGVVTGPYMKSVVAPISEVDSPFITTDVCTWEITARIRWTIDCYNDEIQLYELEDSDEELKHLYASRKELEEAYWHRVAAKKEELA